MKTSNLLTLSQQKDLLSAARITIKNRLFGTDEPLPALTDQVFSQKNGIFVTLHIKKNLRGCIGYIRGFAPLKEAVQEMAISAAFRDPRFNPLTSDEFQSMDIEISILSPIETIGNINEIECGRDGLIIGFAGRSGLLLPQVATEYGWNREEFLSHTCLKAGLPAEAWKEDGVSIEKFSAEVFGEISLGIVSE